MNRVLIIGYVWPEPNSSAAGSRMMQLIDFFLSQNCQVTFASAAAVSSHMADIEARGVRKVSIELNSSSFDEFLLSVDPDIVLFDRFMIEEQFGRRVAQHAPQALRLLDTEDLHSLRDARHKALKASREVELEDLNSELAIREVAAILRSDLTLMISGYEMKLLIEHYGVDERLLLHLPFMLEQISAEPFKSYAERTGYIAIGNFRHQPNWDAVLYLRQTLWPLIREQQPEAQLRIYGAYPPPKATQLHDPKQGFHVEGWAEDAYEVMSQARVCLAPLRFGAGIKGKLIDAMCCGTPNVTTSIGAESMHGNLPWGGVVTDDAKTFADQAVGLYQNEEQWLDAQQAGVEVINTFYNRSTLEKRLLTAINDLEANLDRHRINNFMGAMLMHHSMQSTKYMAQWIEAKNRTAAH